MITWHFCYDGKNPPKDQKEKLCVFYNSHRVWFETCSYIADIYQPDRHIWISLDKGTLQPVYPYAWLEIDKEKFTPQFLENLKRLSKVMLAPKV